MASNPKYTKMMQWLHYRVRVTLQDNRVMVGNFMAFDRHMNVVLSDCEEYRTIKPRSEELEKEVKRMLGLVLLRGETIVSVFPEAPPVKERKLVSEGHSIGSSQAVSRGSLPESSIGLTAAPVKAAAQSAPVRPPLPPLPRTTAAPLRPGNIPPPSF